MCTLEPHRPSPQLQLLSQGPSQGTPGAQLRLGPAGTNMLWGFQATGTAQVNQDGGDNNNNGIFQLRRHSNQHCAHFKTPSAQK